MKPLFAALCALALSGCTMLSAEAPLFSLADAATEFAPPDGLWVAREPDCKVNPARSRPERDTCLEWYRIQREADGAWRVEGLDNDEDEDVRGVVVAATPQRTGASLAPVYVAEFKGDADDPISYFAIVPRGGAEQPLSRLAVAGIECFVLYGDWGEAPGIVIRRGEEDKVVGCTATTKDGVREAARRTVLAALPTLYEQELVFVRK